MVAQAGLFVARDAGGNGTTAKAARQALAGLLAKNSDGTVRTGVLADGAGAVVTGAAGMSYSIRKHVAVTKATEANGPVLVPNDGTVSVTTDPAPGSNSRIDVIYVWQRLVSGDGGSETTVAPVIDVAKGAASAVPSAPSIPGGALELARVTVPAGTTATSGLTFTQGQWTTTTGGTLPNAGNLVNVDWANFNLGNSWVANGAPYATPGFCMRNGVVYARGVMKSGGTGAFLNVALPVGMRPPFDQQFTVISNLGHARVDVQASGAMLLQYYIGAGSNNYVSLDQISFVPA